MEWYVYNERNGKIEPYNIFNHGTFVKYINQHIKNCDTKEDFEEALRSELRYYFWCRTEYELIIEITEYNRILLKPWIGRRIEPVDVTDDTNFDWRGFAEKCLSKYIDKDHGAKFDVYSQVDYVWDDFADYCWNNRKEHKER
jgi:hypothetical protein